MGKLKQIFFKFFIPIVIILVSVISFLIFGVPVGFYITFGLIGALVLFVYGRQFWWWITKTGDYKVYDSDDD